MRHTPRMLAAALTLTTAAMARADIVEATASTVLTGGQQTRGGLPGQRPDLATVVPAYEIMTVTARDVRNPIFDNLELALSTWGALDLVDPRWDVGTSNKHLSGDVTTGYVKGQLFGRHLTLRAGREFVAAGAGRMLQIDGGDFLVQVPVQSVGISVSGFAGTPVSQRFASRSGLVSWNPAGGDQAMGGRVGVDVPLAGFFGRGVDVGVSYVEVKDHGDQVRQDAGFDLRVRPIAAVTVLANATYSLYAARLADLALTALWDVNKKTYVTADIRHTAPDLFLPRNSILSVFADSTRTEVGGGARYRFTEHLSAGADYHLLLEPGETSGTSLGHDLVAKAEWESHSYSAGGEVFYLTTSENGYKGVRAFAKKQLGKIFVAGDVSVHLLEKEVNGNKTALTGTATGGYQLCKDWSAVLSAQAGVTPFLEQSLSVMAKLVYNQTYRVREVR